MTQPENPQNPNSDRPAASDSVDLSLLNLDGIRSRAIMIARMRWLLLCLTALYSVSAFLSFSVSQQHLLTSSSQVLVLGLCFLAVVGYSLLYTFCYTAIQRLKYADLVQVLLDLLLVTVLVYASGSAASWLWVLYLLVILEASVLLPQTRQILGINLLAGLLYGGLLLLGYRQILPTVAMPYIDPGVNQQPLYLCFIWLWVCLLNATVAIAGSSLMKMVHREQRALAASEKKLLSFLESAHDLIFRCTADGRFTYVNPAWVDTLGYSLTDLSDRRLQEIICGEHASRCLTQLNLSLDGETAETFETSLVAKNGILITLDVSFTYTSHAGYPGSVWGICRDLTARKQAEEQLHHLAHHDMLTDLPNRLTFVDRLSQAKALAKRQGGLLAVMFLDLDRFKMINDTLGHDTGDQMLQEIANRLVGCIREVDTVARFGGDEFAILLFNPKALITIEKIALKILKQLSQPMFLNGKELHITTSIGIAVYPNDGHDDEELLKKADIAMYHAKSHGRNTFHFYTSELDHHTEQRLILENSLRRGLENDEFFLHYQPKIDLESGRISALEALVRWRHPQLGQIQPNDFITLAEETGMIVQLGEWVLRQACRQNKLWQEQGLPRVRVAVNVSGFQLEQKDYVQRVQEILDEIGLEGNDLELEITETVIMQNPDFAVRVLNALRDMGVHISIDDFGTGYSSLAHLKRFSVNTLKIDKSFVSEVERSHTDAAITSAIIAMGKSLNLSVIAEGVETEGQREFLQSESCHEVQGYLFFKPLPAEEIEVILRSGQLRQTVQP